ncbi:MAG: hypothetical protein V4510_08255 [bacterium]
MAAFSALCAMAILLQAVPASATITTYSSSVAGGALAVATAMTRGEGANALVTSASWTVYPAPGGVPAVGCTAVAANPTPAGTSDAAITTGFGVPDGAAFGLLTTGDAADANTPSAGANTCSGTTERGANDVVVQRINVQVPPGDNCLTFTFQFLSEEFPEYVNS